MEGDALDQAGEVLEFRAGSGPDCGGILDPGGEKRAASGATAYVSWGRPTLVRPEEVAVPRHAPEPSPEQRRQEVAKLLATGLLRFHRRVRPAPPAPVTPTAEKVAAA